MARQRNLLRLPGSAGQREQPEPLGEGLRYLKRAVVATNHGPRLGKALTIVACLLALHGARELVECRT
jgi:hypothetical protein